MPATLWNQRASSHRARVAPQAEAFVKRRAEGAQHPVWDFLFTYYFFSPAKLMTWVPGIVSTTDEILNLKSQIINDEITSWNPPPVKERDRRAARWIATLCENVLSKPPRFLCHGLHEWAMVYKQAPDSIRHNAMPLRMSPGEIETFVASQSVCCTHYDAFRFFTPEARPLNAHQPVLETRQEMEQSGCLHANMDLYKWGAKLWPWIGSDLVADAFEIAVACRELDMRASPYDLSSLGFAPVRIETEEGRAQYRHEQQRITTMATPVRERLRIAALALCE